MHYSKLNTLRALLMGFESVAPTNSPIYIQVTFNAGLLMFFNTTNEQRVKINIDDVDIVLNPLNDLARKEGMSNQQVPLDTVWDTITSAINEHNNQALIEKYQHFSNAEIHVIWEALHSFSPTDRPKTAKEANETFAEVRKVREIRSNS